MLGMYAGKGGAVLSAPWALASVGLSVISLVNYACMILCIVCLPVSHDGLPGSCSAMPFLLLPMACALCAFSCPMIARSRRCVCVSACAAIGCLSTAPPYLFSHSAVVRPVRIGKGKSKAKQRCVMGIGMCLYAQLVQTKNKQCKSAIIIQ